MATQFQAAGRNGKGWRCYSRRLRSCGPHGAQVDVATPPPRSPHRPGRRTPRPPGRAGHALQVSSLMAQEVVGRGQSSQNPGTWHHPRPWLRRVPWLQDPGAGATASTEPKAHPLPHVQARAAHALPAARASLATPGDPARWRLVLQPQETYTARAGGPKGGPGVPSRDSPKEPLTCHGHCTPAHGRQGSLLPHRPKECKPKKLKHQHVAWAGSQHHTGTRRPPRPRQPLTFQMAECPTPAKTQTYRNKLEASGTEGPHELLFASPARGEAQLYPAQTDAVTPEATKLLASRSASRAEGEQVH